MTYSIASKTIQCNKKETKLISNTSYITTNNFLDSKSEEKLPLANNQERDREPISSMGIIDYLQAEMNTSESRTKRKKVFHASDDEVEKARLKAKLWHQQMKEDVVEKLSNSQNLNEYGMLNIMKTPLTSIVKPQNKFDNSQDSKDMKVERSSSLIGESIRINMNNGSNRKICNNGQQKSTSDQSPNSKVDLMISYWIMILWMLVLSAFVFVGLRNTTPQICVVDVSYVRSQIGIIAQTHNLQNTLTFFETFDERLNQALAKEVKQKGSIIVDSQALLCASNWKNIDISSRIAESMVKEFNQQSESGENN